MDKIILDVPAIEQSFGYCCGPASLAMVLNYYGSDVTQSHINSTIQAQYAGCTIRELKKRAEDLGFEAEAWRMTLDELIENLDKGNPVIVNTHYSLNELAGHFRVAVGHREDERILYHDPFDGGFFEIHMNLFKGIWYPNHAFDRGLVVQPPEGFKPKIIDTLNTEHLKSYRM